MYEYNARVVSVYDGDTVRADVDVGFSFVSKNMQLRLFGINAPEMTGTTKVQGTRSRDALREMVLNINVVVRTYRDRTEKYGRYLATILLLDGTNVNEWLVDQGYAVTYMDDVLKLQRGEITGG